MYLMDMVSSRLMRSTNQHKSTRRVRETCLIVGLLPLIIILRLLCSSQEHRIKQSEVEWEHFDQTHLNLEPEICLSARRCYEMRLVAFSHIQLTRTKVSRIRAACLLRWIWNLTSHLKKVARLEKILSSIVRPCHPQNSTACSFRAW